ncbi:hypothetical protein [Rhizobium sp. BE258]|uniref:hypothetical protein n=1 Tax=Rhizobium sp. BE258 TaxID=2817722 RepID=UPI00285CCA17|nr:hypothetical protein [Rhizobium sp. BE258]MDR7145217.1 hypothetical protein [Rhizobium sp. BE258]
MTTASLNSKYPQRFRLESIVTARTALGNQEAFLGVSISKTLVLRLFLFTVFANGFFADAMLFVQSNGFFFSLLSLFGISLIKVYACWMVMSKVDQAKLELEGWLDYAAVAGLCVLLVAPISGLTWAGLSAVVAYFIVRPGRLNDEGRAIGLVLVGLSFSTFWGKFIARIFMEQILFFDAKLVSLFSGTGSEGNLVNSLDGSVTLVVTEGCSSFSNISLAFLAWLVARLAWGTKGFGRSVMFVSLNIAIVLVVNSVRIACIAWWPQHYTLIHGPIGANIVNVILTVSILSVVNYGARR